MLRDVTAKFEFHPATADSLSVLAIGLATVFPVQSGPLRVPPDVARLHAVAFRWFPDLRVLRRVGLRGLLHAVIGPR